MFVGRWLKTSIIGRKLLHCPAELLLCLFLVYTCICSSFLHRKLQICFNSWDILWTSKELASVFIISSPARIIIELAEDIRLSLDQSIQCPLKNKWSSCYLKSIELEPSLLSINEFAFDPLPNSTCLLACHYSVAFHLQAQQGNHNFEQRNCCLSFLLCWLISYSLKRS